MSAPETRVVVMGDNHGNHADPATLEAILAFCRDFKPHHRVHLGDNWDLAALRRGVGNQDREASQAALLEDIEDDTTSNSRSSRDSESNSALICSMKSAASRNHPLAPVRM